MAATGERQVVMEPDEYYGKSNLKGNPFRSTPNFAADPRASIWVGYAKQKSQLSKYLRRSLADQIGNVNFLMLYGDYGTGKSHALLWAQNLILHEKAEEFDSACYLIPTLRKDKGKLTFAGAFVDDILTKSNLLADLQAFRNFLGKCMAECRSARGFGDEVSDDTVIETLVPAVELSSFAKQIHECQPQSFRSILTPRSGADYEAMIIFSRLCQPIRPRNADFDNGQTSIQEGCLSFHRRAG